MQFFLCTLLLAGCTAPQNYKLMPTPILYVDTSLDRFAHLSDEHKNQWPHVYYATNRIIQESAGSSFLFDVAPQDPFSLSAPGGGPRAVYGVSRADLSAQNATSIARSILFRQSPVFQFSRQ